MDDHILKADEKARRKAYYLANRERIIARVRAAYAADPEAARAAKRADHQRHKESRNAKVKAYRAANPDVRRRANANYSRKHAAKLSERGRRYRAENPEKRAETQRRWREANPHKVNAYGARYRADRTQRTKLHNPELLELVEAEMFEEAARLSRETGIPHEVDHVVPLRGRTVCGLHNEHNLEVKTRAANRSKGNLSWPDMP